MEVQWHRLADEQPPQKGMYLVCAHLRSGNSFVATVWWHKDTDEWDLLPGEGVVTHWMKLPPPPTNKEE